MQETLEAVTDDELLALVRRRNVITGTGALTYFVWTKSDLPSDFGQTLFSRLHSLVSQGKLQDLYPPDVDPARAFLSQTYYIPKEP